MLDRHIITVDISKIKSSEEADGIFFKEKINSKSFSEDAMNKVFYFNGRQAVTDILNFRIVSSTKYQNDLLELAKS